jgi:hypothetical protein
VPTSKRMLRPEVSRPYFLSEALAAEPIEGAQALALEFATHIENAHNGVVYGGPDWVGPRKLRLRTIGARAIADLFWVRPASVTYLPRSGLTRAAVIRASLIAVVARRKTDIVVLQRHYQIGKLPQLLTRRLLTIVASTSSLAKEFEQANFETVLLSARVASSRVSRIGTRQAAKNKLGYGSDRVYLHVGHAKKNRNLHAMSHLTQYGRVQLILSPYEPEEPGAVPEEPGVDVLRSAVPDIGDYYRAADVYVFPCRDEKAVIGLPMTIIEALANGTPVVAYRTATTARWAGHARVTLVTTDEELTEMAGIWAARADDHADCLAVTPHGVCQSDIRPCRDREV